MIKLFCKNFFKNPGTIVKGRAILFMLLPFLYGFTQVNIMGNNVGKCLEGNGDRITSSRELNNFSEVHVDGAFEVKTTAGKDKQKLTITTDRNLLEQINTEVKNGKLLISVNKSICSNKPVQILLEVMAVKKIVSNGASDIDIMMLDNEAFQLTAEGSGTINISGRTNIFNADIAGAVELGAEKLLAKSVDIQAKGASSARVFVSEKLKAFSDGASEILYKGGVQRVEKEEMGASEVRKDDM